MNQALPEKIFRTIALAYRREFGFTPRLMSLDGTIARGTDPFAGQVRVRKDRLYALHESINLGAPFTFAIGPAITSWLVAIEDKRVIHGALIGGEILAGNQVERLADGIKFLAGLGMHRAAAAALMRRIPRQDTTKLEAATRGLSRIFYDISGWQPILMRENQLRFQQKQQISQAIEDQRQRGDINAYPFEKERVLLSLIRAGDRTGARRVLNEMLAAMYLSSPRLVLLRARAIEMMGYLTRAAVEDSPVMEPLIERNHEWMAKLIRARDFEDLAHVLTDALNDFIEGIYLAGFNRTNRHVTRALEFINANYMKPVTLANVAATVGISPYRLAHLVKEHTGKSIIRILNQIRIENARRLLDQTDKRCTDVAYEVGYSDQSYFIRHFRRLTGITPARYRRSHRNIAVDSGAAP